MTAARGLFVGVIAILALLVIGASVYVGASIGTGLRGADAPPIPAPTSELAPVPSDPPPAQPTDTAEPLPTETTTSAPPLITDPPARPDDLGVEPTVVEDSAGKACRTSEETIAGGYPAGSCRFWKQSRGLMTDEALESGSQRIACQRDLEIENPVYTAKQTNTWWMWTTSDDGTWDWFPATAVAEGASDEPISGVALCEQ